ncbi:O-antigen ligase family protein [Rubellicoccus peritrichatus]|uniref:O-antigen ligase family protein n=1 Tax=Rubellicoccus peritrichatus TaxID=3080537 RepID=A0AAQ3QW09_9BACT|nr:O-antigen ligase family protein [Puniceicoccus sp. CR14]WOO41445.1 O-antigen ligase family protein [Puniceicoccus sp. CR14]
MRTRSFFFGIFGDPNDTALFLVSSLPLIWALFCNQARKKYWIGILLCLFVFLATLSTESRSGQMAIIFMAGGYILLRFPVSKLWSIVPIAFLGLVLSPYLMVKIGWTDDSAMDRFNYWGQANYAFKSSPVFGVGYGMVTDYTYLDASAHNSFVTAYAELGIIGYTAWLALIMFALYSMLRISKMEPDSPEDIEIKAIATGLFASLIATCASGFFITRTYYMPLFITLAICAALYGYVASRLGWAQMNDYCGWKPRSAGVAISASITSIIFIYIFIIILNKIA